MRHVFNIYRQGLYDRLRGLTYKGVKLVVYQYPPMTAEAPYVLIDSMEAVPHNDMLLYSQIVTVDIHILTRYFGDQASAVVADEIADVIMQGLVSKGRTAGERAIAIAMTGFTMTPNQLVRSRQVAEFDDVDKHIRTILTIEGIIDQDV